MSDDEKIKQEATGIGNAQIIGDNSRAFVKNSINYPHEKILLAELITILILQVPMNFCMLSSILDADWIICATPFALCPSLPIGINAVYALVTGIMKKDKKIIILSSISGILALTTFCLYLTAAAALNARVGR